MRFNDIYVAGVASWLPPREPIGQGRYKPGEQEPYAYESASVAGPDDAPPDMAIRAGRLALARSGVDPAEVSLLFHASVWYQGLDMWSPSSYIHHALLGENRMAQAIDLNQQCAGGVSALHLMADHLVANPDRRAAIVTTAERYAPPGMDRWHTEGAHIIFGDGASSLVLARDRGFARLLAVNSVADTTLEAMNRGDSKFTLFSPAAQGAVDIEARGDAFLKQMDGPKVVARLNQGHADAVHGLLDEAGLKISDVSRFIFPNIGLGLLTHMVNGLGIDVSQTAWELGRTTGHVGPADPFIGLAYLLEQGQLSVGDRVMLAGIGYGWYWACALVECVEIPDWSPAA
ncbi:MAG TPA: ketoacyl-ACP synthase III family protein [Streptosporangiaceae bacterium]|jgi:3-oxoacyl-[acyl-carrier-protein] synthase-3